MTSLLNGIIFSLMKRNHVFSLIKDYNRRPKYRQLLSHPFLIHAQEETAFDMGKFICSVLE